VLGSDYISDIRSLVHDLTTQDWSDTELLKWTNQARQRVALDAHCVRNLFVGNLISQQETYPATNCIPGCVVTVGGSGYSATPTVTIAAPGGGGITATATAVVVSGVITQILMTNWGTNYTSQPNVTITDGTGVGASASSAPMLNTLDHISITTLYPGQAQGQMLAWYDFTTFQAWLRFNRQQFGFPAAWTRYDEQKLLYFGRPPDQSYVCEMDVAINSTALASTATLDTQVTPPYDDAVKFYGAYLALLKLQNFEHAERLEKKYEKRVLQILMTKQERRIRNVYNNTYRRMMRGG
jgi:hypothetical protein